MRIRIVCNFKKTLKIFIQLQIIDLKILFVNQLGKESKSLEIGSQGGRVSTHYAMDKETLSKIPKEN